MGECRDASRRGDRTAIEFDDRGHFEHDRYTFLGRFGGRYGLCHLLLEWLPGGFTRDGQQQHHVSDNPRVGCRFYHLFRGSGL